MAGVGPAGKLVGHQMYLQAIDITPFISIALARRKRILRANRAMAKGQERPMKFSRALPISLFSAILIAPVGLAQPDLGSENWTLKRYDGNRDQFTLEIPEGWHVVDQTPYRETGVVAFYSKPLVMRLDNDPVVREAQQRQMMALADDLMSGAAPAFFMDRYKAAKGMSCTGFSEQARNRKLKIVANSPALGKGTRMTGGPETAPIDFGGCKGLRILMHLKVPANEDQTMLVYSAAADGITYDFVLLTDAQYFERNLPWFERVIATVRLTAGQ